MTREVVTGQLVWKDNVIQDNSQKVVGEKKVMALRCRRFGESLRREGLSKQHGTVLRVWALELTPSPCR